VAGIIEKSDGAWAGGLNAPRVSIDCASQRTEASVACDCNLEAKTLERAFEQRNVIVRIGEPADLVSVCFVTD
jgi:hypothetical protein